MIDDGELPATDLAWKIQQFQRWNGDAPKPEISHWTSTGSIIIRAATVFFTTEVLWRPKDGNERQLGYGPYRIEAAAELIARGEYDKNAGFEVSKITPSNIAAWNDLAG